MKVKTSKKIVLLIATNAVTLLLFLAISVRENYPQRIAQRLFSPATENSFSNIRYNQARDFFAIYHGERKIVMLGTSLTEGVNWNELLDRADIAGRGIGGDITEGFINRLDNVFAYKPKICFIEGGINDLARSLSQTEIMKNLTILVDTLQQNNIKPVVSTVTFVAKFREGADKLNKKITEINKEIYQLAETKGISVIDLNQKVSDGKYLKNEFAIEISIWTGKIDGVHFKPATYLVWKDEVEKILAQENYKFS